MPLSEFIRLTKGKVGATHQKASHLSTDLTNGISDNDCFELVCQNGQLMMQGQSSRARKGSIPNDFPTFISKLQDGKDPKNSKMAEFNAMNPMLNDFPLSAPSCEMGLDQDDDTVSWLNCPMVEPFNNEYCSDFLPESGVAGNELSKVNSSASLEKRSRSNHLTDFPHSTSTADAPSIKQRSKSKDLSSVTELNKLRISETSPLMQRQHTVPRSGCSEITQSDAGKDFTNSVCCSSPACGSMGSKLHKYDAGQPSNSSVLMNFSYFSRFASLTGFNLRNTAATTDAVVSSAERVGDEIKGDNHKPVEPTLVNCSHQESGFHVELSLPLSARGVKSQTPKLDPLPPQQSEAICLNDSKNDKSLDQPFGAVPIEVVAGGEKAPEPAVVASSVCSDNRLERASNDPACSLKRKFPELGDSESTSDEAEGKSVGFKKTASGRTGSKRSRAAEVHNLSERRRRERINEKLQALQELIPNCNKADKASMLDEAIEYLKRLQLQLQILSMGNGMYMPPMMLPAGMQQMHRAHMPLFSPIGIGMGMGMGFGMGMQDVNYSMTQMPNIQGPCYPVPGPPISTSSTFHGAIGLSHQGLGHPGQELLVSMPCVPLPLLGSPPMRLPVGNVSAMPHVVDLPLLAPSANSKEMVQNVGSQVPYDQSHRSMNEDSNQATVLHNVHYPAVDADGAQNHGCAKPS